jgi:hypothetical protein
MGTVLATPKASPYHPAINQTVGRPDTFRPEYCEQVVDYFSSRAAALRAIGFDWKSAPKEAVQSLLCELPTFAGFAASIGTSRTRLNDWANRHPSFREAYAHAKEIYEQCMADGLASGRFNPTGAIFVAKNTLGWKDKTEVETVNSQDSQDMAGMRAALAAATPEQLKQFAELVAAMQARVPAASLPEPTQE